ncbi:MAG TPA: MFS transporter [Candidatus Nanoarchaeia archaeon]|nr:MFS transporter [Candidatus Nanoarchaeia archaeon]
MKKLSDQDKKLFERNILVMYLISALFYGRFFLPVLALFYIASQVPLEQFAIIISVFSLSILLLEIPTGVFTDLIGKKKTMILVGLMYIIELFILAFFDGFWPFLIAKIISGIGVSLGSGTYSSLIYDSLKRLKRQKENKTVSGKMAFVAYLSLFFIFIIGAYLFSIYYKLPAYFSLAFMIFGFILTFLLKEPYEPIKKFNFKNSYLHFKQGISYFFKKPYLIYLGFFTLIIGSVINIILIISSSYYELILVPVSLIGVVAAVGTLLSAYSSKTAHKWEKIFGEKKSLLLVQLSVLVATFFISLMIPKFGILFFLLISLTFGFYSVITGDYVNRHAKTSHRTTMLSINNMFTNIGIFFLLPLLGYSIKSFGMSKSFFFLFILICFYLLVLFLFARKLK